MDNLNVTMLNDQFNMYYAAAKRAYEAGNGALAKRSYMLAADTLLKLAKVSSPKLKQARLERAKRLLQIADGIGAAVERKTIPAGSDDDEEQGREWAAAAVPDVHFSDIAGLDDVKKGHNRAHDQPCKVSRKIQTLQQKVGRRRTAVRTSRHRQDDDSPRHSLRGGRKVLRNKGLGYSEQVGGRIGAQHTVAVQDGARRQARHNIHRRNGLPARQARRRHAQRQARERVSAADRRLCRQGAKSFAARCHKPSVGYRRRRSPSGQVLAEDIRPSAGRPPRASLCSTSRSKAPPWRTT